MLATKQGMHAKKYDVLCTNLLRGRSLRSLMRSFSSISKSWAAKGHALQTSEHEVTLCKTRSPKLTVVLVHERLVPEGADVHTQHFGGLDDLAETPHERSVHAHQLLPVHLVRLVQDASECTVGKNVSVLQVKKS